MSRIGNLIKKAQSYKGQEFKMPRMFVPSNMIVPQTAKDVMAKQLYQAGIITKDDYEKMLGVVYDGDFNDESEVFSDEAFARYDDEFKLSDLSEYYDDYEADNTQVLGSSSEYASSPDVVSSETSSDNRRERNSESNRDSDSAVEREQSSDS